MVRRLTVFLLFVFVFIRVIEAQSIIGTLVDDDTQQPIEGATILLQAADSAYIGTSVSGTDGVFILNNYIFKYIFGYIKITIFYSNLLCQFIYLN